MLLHTEDSYSSSGRGLLWLPERKLTTKDRTWIEGALNKQGCVSIECALDKYQDFAMEFYSDGNGNIRYEGLSVFGAEKKGAYSEMYWANRHIWKASLLKTSETNSSN